MVNIVPKLPLYVPGIGETIPSWGCQVCSVTSPSLPSPHQAKTCEAQRDFLGETMRARAKNSVTVTGQGKFNCLINFNQQ